MEAHALEHHHGPPEANRSSRVDARTLGMLLFIISEVMVFGAFFTAYFFIRVVGGARWSAVRWWGARSSAARWSAARSLAVRWSGDGEPPEPTPVT